MKKIITLVITIAMVFTMTVPAFADEVAQANGLLQVTGVTAINYSTTSLKLYWNEVKGAESYQVYGATSKSGKYYLKKTTSSLSYVNSLLTCGKTYYYKVRAVGAGSYGAYSSVVSKKVQPKKVTITYVKPPKDYDNRVHWSKLSNVSGYQVYRKRTDKTTWSWYKTVTAKSSYATDTLSGKDLNYDWEYKVRAYKVVNGKSVYGYFSEPKKWTPDWTIEQIYEESWKYVEAMKFQVYEYIEGKKNPDMWERYYWPVEGQMYSWKHCIGWDNVTYQTVYTNPVNGNITKTANFEKATPDNSNWGVLWPVPINPYMTHDSIMKKIKGKLDVELTDISNANPLFWDTEGGWVDNEWHDDGGWSGSDSFTIYYEKYLNGYKLWQLW